MSSTTFQIRVVKFTLCSSTSCTYPKPHLLVEQSFTTLRRGNAVAISYTWGEFDRCMRSIGHYADQSPAMLELGREWGAEESPDFITTLASLSRTRSDGMRADYAWIDQLSIRQSDTDEIRATLARIPDIYRELDTITLMPGAICECKLRYLKCFEDEMPHATDDTSPQRSQAIERLRREDRLQWHCVSNMGFRGWFTRLWTRQELVYTSRCRLQWTSSQVLTCKVDRDAYDPSTADETVWASDSSSLNVVARIHVSIITDSVAEEDRYVNFIRLHERAGGAWMSAYASVREWEVDHLALEDRQRLNAPSLGMFNPIRFLCGHTIERNVRSAESRSIKDQFSRFQESLHALQLVPRSATQTRDYVLALWVDCPKYEIPLRFKSMTSVDLLEDALRQIESKLGFSFVSMLPTGLFGMANGTALWRPSKYLDKTKIQNTGDIYNALFDGESYLFRVGGDQQVRCIMTDYDDEPSSGGPIQSFNAAFGGMSVSDAFDLIIEMICCWRTSILLRFTGEVINTVASLEPELSATKLKLLDCINDAIISQTEGVNSDDESITSGSEEEDEGESADESEAAARKKLEDLDEARELVYILVCNAIGIAADSALTHGLQLMIHMGSEPGTSTPVIGLVQKGFPFESGTNTSTVFATSDRAIGADGKGLYYEVVSDQGYGEPQRHVVGVWVPLEKYERNIEADVGDQAWNGAANVTLF